jgi:acyl-coenzyme A synthetase/AMP-(fatty) acid ligase
VNPTRVRLLGRREDLIKRAGKRASLAGLTQALMEIEGVEDGVFVAPENLDSEPTARLTAYVVAPTRSVAEIRAALSQKIEPAFLPRRIIKLERLPRNTTGKLPRQELLALSARFGDPSQTADSAR